MSRAWLPLLLLAAAGCTRGTSGWVLSEQAAASSDASTPDASPRDSGLSDAQAADAGDAASSAAHCPSRFASVCSPAIVIDNRDLSGSGQLFADAIPDPATTIPCITRDVCATLYRKESEIKNLTEIDVIVENFDGVSETYGSGTVATIHMSSRYLQMVSDAGSNVGDEIRGILYYHGANMYQLDDGNGAANAWLVQGVADFVRHAGGYLPDSQRQAGGAYNDGYTTTAFFLVWLDAHYTDFVYELNLSLNPNDGITWTPQAFQDITGQSVDALWASYQGSF